MSYDKTNWVNEPSMATPLSAANLNHLGAQYDAVATDIADPNTPVGAQVSARVATATKTIAARPPKVSGAVFDTGYTGVQAMEYHDGVLWGSSGGQIQKSTDDGVSWVDVAAVPNGGTYVYGILWCADGEILVNQTTAIVRSVGWATNPATATWVTKVTKSAPAGPGILRWGLDGDGTKFIATEYSSDADRSQSRYVWVSLDAGVTWSIVLDKFTIDPTNTSHMHGVCYDPWADRFWLSHGHGTIRGTYYSDDDGTTWTKIGGAFQPDAAPSAMLATDDGIVCGSDSIDGGLFGIARTPSPADMEMRHLARWSQTTVSQAGWAMRGFRDTVTGLVYFAFKSSQAGISSTIAAGTARSGAFIWAADTPAIASTANVVVTTSGKLVCIIQRDVATFDRVTAQTLLPGAVGFDGGNLDGGTVGQPNNVAVGPSSSATAQGGTAVGANATTIGVGNSTAIGVTATAGTRGVAVGSGAANGLSTETDSTAVGHAATAAGTNSVAIGSGASTYPTTVAGIAVGKTAIAGNNGVAIGSGAKAGSISTHQNAVAVGANAVSSSTGVALGSGANAGTSSVALGQGAATTDTNQVQIGARYLAGVEMVTTPAAPPANGYAFYAKDNGSGKTQLVVKFANNVEIVLATSA